MSNSQSRIANTALAALAIFAAGTFAPVMLLGIDGMQGGYALGLLSFFLAIVAGVTWLVIRRRAKMLDAFLAGRDILARWEVPADAWARFVATDLAEESSSKRSLFLIMSGWMAAIGGLFLLVDAEAGAWVVAVFIAVLAITAPLAFWYPARRAERQVRQPTPIVVGAGGAYLGGQLHDWSLAGSFLTGVELDENADPTMLRIHYCYLTGHGAPMPMEVRIPVPAGSVAAAIRVRDVLLGLAQARARRDG